MTNGLELKNNIKGKLIKEIIRYYNYKKILINLINNINKLKINYNLNNNKQKIMKKINHN